METLNEQENKLQVKSIGVFVPKVKLPKDLYYLLLLGFIGYMVFIGYFLYLILSIVI